MKQINSDTKIAVLGLGYVGLPLALELSKYFRVIGFEINLNRVKTLKKGIDYNKEHDRKDLVKYKKIIFTTNNDLLINQDYYIITAPTPLSKNNQPDFKPLINATKLVSRYIKKGATVIYESTVYPGATEEICVPILEKNSKLIYNKDFFCGYSPERINPGDKTRTITKIKKIVSGSNLQVLKNIKNIYSRIIKAGIYTTSSIKVAEAAKSIENTQRDLNIAFINELSFLFNKLGIETSEVLKAASTKWNFLKFEPGLVGGHCVGVDPYYLTYKSKKIGYKPKIILSGRKINEEVPNFISSNCIKLLKRKKIIVKNSKILIAGFSFKKNCTDSRNTKIFNIYQKLKRRVKLINVYDPIVNKKNVLDDYKIKLINQPKKNFYDGLIIGVDHDIFKKKKISFFKSFLKKNSFIFDIKSIYKKSNSDMRL